MPHRDSPPLTKGVVLRVILLLIAVALGGASAWLIVTSSTQRRLELGVLAGLWSALMGAFAMFGSRRFAHPMEVAYGEQATASAELELRASRLEVERAEEIAARRAHEAWLERMLPAQIQAAINREVGALRSELAELRSELLEKVGGQLRLERIETTRVLGSDLEALQHEVRQLKAAANEVDRGGWGRPRLTEAPVRQIVEPAKVRPVSRETAQVEADVQPAQLPSWPAAPRPSTPVAPPVSTPVVPSPSPPVTPPAARHEPAAPLRLNPLTLPQSAPSTPPQRVSTPPPPAEASRPSFARPQPPAQPAQPRPAPARPVPASPAPPAPAQPVNRLSPPSATPADPFAGLPRIRPFTDFELDPIEDEPAYTGRRRRTEGEEKGSGRHSQSDESGRRQVRGADKGNDLLAAIFAREGISP